MNDTDEPIEGLPASLGLETTTELRLTLREHAGAWKQAASFHTPSILALVRDHDRLAAEVARLTSALALASEREATARSEEREACAKIADQGEFPEAPYWAERECADRIAAAIRARSAPYPAADAFEAWLAKVHERK